MLGDDPDKVTMGGGTVGPWVGALGGLLVKGGPERPGVVRVRLGELYEKRGVKRQQGRRRRISAKIGHARAERLAWRAGAEKFGC